MFKHAHWGQFLTDARKYVANEKKGGGKRGRNKTDTNKQKRILKLLIKLILQLIVSCVIKSRSF